MKICPFCAQKIEDEAIKCNQCGEFFNEEKKWEKIYEYSLDILKDEQARYISIEQKAERFLLVLTLIFSVYSFFLKDILSCVSTSNKAMGYISTGLCISVYIVMIAALILIIISLNIQPLKLPTMDEKTFDFFQEKDLMNIYFGLTKDNKNFVQNNIDATNRKVIKLEWSYWLIFLSVLLISVLLMLNIFVFKTGKEVNQMADDKPKSSAPIQPVTNQVVPVQNIMKPDQSTSGPGGRFVKGSTNDSNSRKFSEQKDQKNDKE